MTRPVLIAAALLVAQAAFAQPPRDVRRLAPGGAARIAGTVRSADSQARVLRRARVMLNGDALPVGRTLIVDDNGAFAFEGLPAGRYTLAATKEGYVTAAYGARRPERPGRSILVRNGETRTVSLRLQRGAVITGTVLDASGDPAPGVNVTALTWRYMAASGERRPITAASAVTDDRGIYRIFGLPLGEYVVQGVPRLPLNDVQVLSDREIQRALASLRETSAFRSRPGIAPPTAASLPPPEPRNTVALAPVFYPGTTIAARARAIDLGPAEERAGIDFQLDYVPTATISGTVSEPATITLMPSAHSAVPVGNVRGTKAGADGRFTLTSITPGEYTIVARVFPLGPTPMSAGPPTLAKSAQAEVFVDGNDVAGVPLALQPGLTISGRLIFEGDTPAPPLLAGFRLPMPASMALGSAMVMPSPPLQFQENGRFSIAGVMPGEYRLAINTAGIRVALGSWWLKSISLGGREILDGPIELREDRDDAVVTFSDRASELTGRVADARGNAWVDGYVVVFSCDRMHWFFNSRRIAGARPNSEGRYMIRNLPAGEYFVVAYDDVMINEWFDPALLDELVARAARIRIGENERKTYDLVFR